MRIWFRLLPALTTLVLSWAAIGCGGGSGGGVGAGVFNCLAKGIYNFAIVTVTNTATTTVNLRILAYPCPHSWVIERMVPGQKIAFYTHYPSSLSPSFQVDLGGLNSYTPTPNIVASKPWPQFVNQITYAMGSQYNIVQTSPGVFALKAAS